MARISFTQKAARRVAQLRKSQGDEKLMLRLSVDGGGCSGFQYRFDFSNEATSDDAVFTTLDVSLVIDQTSLDLLDGSEVDYVTTLAGSAFAVKTPMLLQRVAAGPLFP